MPTSARTALGFFGQFADVGIRAPEQNGLLQQALASPGEERPGSLRRHLPTAAQNRREELLRILDFGILSEFGIRNSDFMTPTSGFPMSPTLRISVHQHLRIDLKSHEV